MSKTRTELKDLTNKVASCQTLLELASLANDLGVDPPLAHVVKRTLCAQVVDLWNRQESAPGESPGQDQPTVETEPSPAPGESAKPNSSVESRSKAKKSEQP